MITTIIFDLDDTLYDEIDFCRSVADNETKDFIAPNRLGILTIQVQRPHGLYRQPSPLPDAAPKLRLAEIGALPGLLTSL